MGTASHLTYRSSLTSQGNRRKFRGILGIKNQIMHLVIHAKLMVFTLQYHSYVIAATSVTTVKASYRIYQGQGVLDSNKKVYRGLKLW